MNGIPNYNAFSLLHELSEKLEAASQPVSKLGGSRVQNYPEVLRRMFLAVGVATSGLGGRSLTKGVASAVTCFARQCSLADAAATAIANATNCDDPLVERCLAEDLDTGTDIKGQVVTHRMGPLSSVSVATALDKGIQRSRELFESGFILGSIIFVQGRIKIWPFDLVDAVQEVGISRK